MPELVSVAVGGIVNVILSNILIRQFGVNGLLVSVCISYIVCNAIRVVVLARMGHVKPNAGIMIQISLGVTAFCGMYFVLPKEWFYVITAITALFLAFKYRKLLSVYVVAFSRQVSKKRLAGAGSPSEP